jgi:hypothetical protein
VEVEIFVQQNTAETFGYLFPIAPAVHGLHALNNSQASLFDYYQGEARQRC